MCGSLHSMKAGGEPLIYRATALWERAAGKTLYAVFELFFWMFLWRWNRGAIHGGLPDGPIVLTPNHGSYLDWLLLDVIFRRSFGRDVSFLAKQKVVRNPFFRALARERHAIVFDDESRKQAVAFTVSALSCADAGSPPAVCVFPEGTRSRTGEKSSFFPGAAALARQFQAQIVPVALCGFWEVWPPQKRLPTLTRIGLSVHFLEPIDPGGTSDDVLLVEAALDRAYAMVALERRKREKNHA